jgi:hypothetical protein
LVRKNLGAVRRQRVEEHVCVEVLGEEEPACRSSKRQGTLSEEIVVEEEVKRTSARNCLGLRRSSSRILLGEDLPRPEKIIR